MDLARYDLTPHGLVAARQALGLTAEQLATALGVTRQAVSAWETGKHPIDRRTGLAMALLARVLVERQDRRNSVTYDNRQLKV